MSTLETLPYKGVRDFYPRDMAIQNYIFSTWKNVVSSFGYEEYSASVLEPAELYRAKSGEEIVNEQTYTFTDRGDREVTLRPEMTPTVARMVAHERRNLPTPIRWFSIPNLFRYEKPQRGRLREHWQLNVDIFGVSSIQAEVEVIACASQIMTAFGLKPTDYEIRLNNRKLMTYIMKSVLKLSDTQEHALSKLIDKKAKISAEDFEKAAIDIMGEHNLTFFALINSNNFEEFTSHLAPSAERDLALNEIRQVISGLDSLGITNVVFSQTLMRGFDYYTGIVFEIFDKNPDNRRSLFGGGRYDNLVGMFGGDSISAVGFGMGDVTMRDVLETYNLLPPITTGPTLTLCVLAENIFGYAHDIAQNFRSQGVRVAIDYSLKKIGDQFKSAERHGSTYVFVLGETEMNSGSFDIKNLETGETRTISKDYQLK